MEEVMNYVEHEVPDSGYVSLIADGQACQLYEQFGFAPTAPKSIGMALKEALIESLLASQRSNMGKF